MSKRFNFKHFPTLMTERLRLREITLEDTASIFQIRGDYEVTKYNIGAAYTSYGQAQALIENIAQSYRERKNIRWGITLSLADEVIGMAGFNYWDRTDHRGSIGFDLRRDYWRQGIMSEALQRIIRFAFVQMQLNRIEADASIYNEGSIALLKRFGFKQEGIQREQYFEDGAYHDLVLFSLLRREWQAEDERK